MMILWWLFMFYYCVFIKPPWGTKWQPQFQVKSMKRCNLLSKVYVSFSFKNWPKSCWDRKTLFSGLIFIADTLCIFPWYQEKPHEELIHPFITLFNYFSSHRPMTVKWGTKVWLSKFTCRNQKEFSCKASRFFSMWQHVGELLSPCKLFLLPSLWIR